MEIFFDFGSDLKHKLLVGNNKLTDEYYINVQEVYTFVIGTCYVIKSNVPMPPPVFLKITLEFNDTMNEVDLPKVNLPTQFCNLQSSRALPSSCGLPCRVEGPQGAMPALDGGWGWGDSLSLGEKALKNQTF